MACRLTNKLMLRLFFRKKSSKQAAAVLVNRKQLTRMLGFRPWKLTYYQLAFVDPALRKQKNLSPSETNDRLEFLGDSILGMHISRYLYNTYPQWNVGQLAALKSHIVSRSVSNKIAQELDLKSFLPSAPDTAFSKDTPGNLLEALIGAIFLDRGFAVTQLFIEKKVLPIYHKIKKENTNFGVNFKGTIQSWADRNYKTLVYNTTPNGNTSCGGFKCELYIDEKLMGVGRGRTKKESEQEAAALAVRSLHLVPPGGFAKE